MDPYNLGSILLDISIGTLALGALARLALVLTWRKRGGGRGPLSDGQRATLRNLRRAVAIVGLAAGLAALALLSRA